MTSEELKKAFEVLHSIMAGIPLPAKSRRNMLDIAGYPSWENVNSNLLAFYLNEDEDHNFKRLFFNALLDVLRNKGVDVPDIYTETTFTVHREWDNIDILIESDNHDWAIIIENKINHHLHNDLKAYWNRVNVPNKIGIVLSLYGQHPDVLLRHKEEGIIYHNILHRDLVEEVKKNLHSVYNESDDRHLLYLKDYVDNINQFYINKIMTPENQSKLDIYQNNYELLDKLRNTEAELHDYVSDSLFRALMEFGFLPHTNSFRVKSKHFYADENHPNYHDGYKGFRIYVVIDDILKYNYLTLYFELYEEYAQYGAIINKVVWAPGKTYGDILFDSTGGHGGGQYYHIAGIEDHALVKENGETIYEKLKNAFQQNLFNENGIVKTSAELLKNELNK